MSRSSLSAVILTLTTVIICCCYGTERGYAQDFAYYGIMGPAYWGEQYNTCGGKHQSPININVLDVVEKPLTTFKMNDFDVTPPSGELVNNGHTVVVRLNYDDETVPTVSGGPLDDLGIFKFSQFHFHWGSNNSVGSEDRINNVSFPAELHMVFYNAEYDTFNEALTYRGGVVVLAFFFALQEENNLNYAEIIELLQNVREPHMHTPFLNPPKLQSLISRDRENYFTYVGSLTTPPCSEDVTWIDFETPIMISTDQIEAFRCLYTHDGVPLTHNYRPIQPLNNRIVYKAKPMPSPAYQISATNEVKSSEEEIESTIVEYNRTTARTNAVTYSANGINGAASKAITSSCYIFNLFSAVFLVQIFSTYI